MKTALIQVPSEASAPRAVEELLHKAQLVKASDVHLQMTGKSARVFFRVDGVMAPAGELSEGLAERVFGRIKYLAKLKTYQESLPQDGRIDKADAGLEHDVRVATYPTVTGEKIVLRLFSDCVQASVDSLGYPPGATAALNKVLRQSTGLMLLTGPAGSGKTTTIYACLRHLSESGGKHVITVEDPVEQIVPGIMQTEVNEARGLTFATAARHLLRQDPQALVLGEIRDDETANLAVRAALTGHLVISTLHAGSCKGVFERLMLMCRDEYAVLSAVQLIVNQRLVRRLCAKCHGEGCSECLEIGYRGRVPLVEWLPVTAELRTEIREHGLNGIAPQNSFAQAAAELLARGVTDHAELQRVCDL